MEALTPRPRLTAEQLDWAESVGVSAKRAYWLASCPSGTRCGNQDRPVRQIRKRPNRYLWKAGDVWCFRVVRTDLKINRMLSKDLFEARAMRDNIEASMGLIPKHKFIL